MPALPVAPGETPDAPPAAEKEDPAAVSATRVAAEDEVEADAVAGDAGAPAEEAAARAVDSTAHGPSRPELEDMTYGQRLCEVARAFFPMGFIAFGGPQAHIGLFLKTFVDDDKTGEKKWLDEQRFMELMSLGQAMPGPTSTQMATAMGICRAGPVGGIVSFLLFDWVGFAVLMGVGTALHYFNNDGDQDALDTYKMIVLGMGPAAISQVYIAAYKLSLKAVGMDKVRIFLCVCTCVVALLVRSAQAAAYVFLACLVVGGIVTVIDSHRPSRQAAYEKVLRTPEDRGVIKNLGITRLAGVLLVLFTFGFFGLTQALIYMDASSYPSERGARYMAIFASMYKMGISIYGGGQVVLPLLESEFVTRTGYPEGSAAASLGEQPVSPETFGFGLALAQSLPGPLFNFSAFLGAVIESVPGGFLGFIGLFGPGIMLIYAFMPFWEAARKHAWVRVMLVGMNAASIGLVISACVTLFFKFCNNGAEAACMIIAIALVFAYNFPPPAAIFLSAALCLCLFLLDIPGVTGDWCHIAKYGDFSTQNADHCVVVCNETTGVVS